MRTPRPSICGSKLWVSTHFAFGAQLWTPPRDQIIEKGLPSAKLLGLIGYHRDLADYFNLTLALDVLFEKLQRNHDLTRVKAIGGAAQVCNQPARNVEHTLILVIVLARFSVVEIDTDPQLPGPGPAAPPARAITTQHLLPPQHPHRAGHLRAHARARARGAPRWAGHYGLARRPMRARVPPRRAAPPRARGVADRRVGQDGQDPSGELVPGQLGVREVGGHGRGRGGGDGDVGSWGHARGVLG